MFKRKIRTHLDLLSMYVVEGVLFVVLFTLINQSGRMCFLPIHSGHQVRWTYQPGSHRKKVTQDFSSTFFLYPVIYRVSGCLSSTCAYARRLRDKKTRSGEHLQSYNESMK